MASVSDLHARRDEKNNTRTLFNSEGVYEAAEDNSSQIILETPDPDIVKTISHYFEAALSGQKYVVSHPVTDHGTESSADSSDSGDSLFITQVPVSEVVRSVRRCHSKERSEFTCTIESGEEDGPATPQRKQQVSPAMKHHKRKAEKHGLKKYSFPFLGSIYRSKHLSSRERAYRNTHLPLLKSVTFASKAIGGFFRCVKTLKKFSKGKVTLASALPNRYLDEEGELSPLSEQEEESKGSDDDIRVVENELLTPFLKKKKRQTWRHPLSEAEKQCRKFSSVSKYFTTKTKKQSTKKTQHLPHVKQTLSLVSKMIKDTTSKRSVAGSRRIIPEKCNMAEEETNPESVNCVRRCSSGRSLVRNETDAEEPGIQLADNTDGQEENDNMDISLTEWKTMLNIGFVSEEGERSRIDQAVDIMSSPINEVQESEGSCLERTQVNRAMTSSVTGPCPDRDHQNQTRETEADPGIKGHNPPSTDLELTNYCTNVDAGGDDEQKGKKRKKKNRKRERGDDESIEDRVGQNHSQEAPDDQELVTCVSTGTIQGGEATEITQDNKAEHSVSGEMIMPRKKKRKKERRESPCQADTDIGLRQEENAKLSSHAGGGAIVQTDDIELKKIKKKDKNSTAHAIPEEGPEKEHFQNLSLESQLDEVIGPQKGTNISTLPQDTVTNLQVNTTEIRQKTIECSIVQLTEFVAQRKKYKTMAPIENSLTRSDGTVSFRKKKKAKKDWDSFCSNEMAGNDTEIPLSTSTLSQSGEIDTLEKKKHKRDKKQNSDTHEDSETRPKENVKTHERSEDMFTEKKRKKKKRRRSSTDEGAIVQQQEDNTPKFHVTLKSSVSESIDTVPPRKKEKKDKDRDLVTPLSAEESHQKDNIPPETDEITSPRKLKKKKRDGSKDTCSVIHKDTAAPLEKESIGISLEGCESFALTPDYMVSQRKTKKNKNSLTQHDPEERLKNDATKISQRMSAAVKNSRPEEKKEIVTTEVRLEAESAFISSKRKRKKTKRRKSTDNEAPEVGHQDNDNTAILIETTQSSITQYTETESQKKKKKKKKKNRKTNKESVAPEGTD
ncbi:unnamed protein product [Coregonus sp. 'balchen']|nr:unnamed protein product [Coregonus sp. 'balchen']